MGLNIPNVAKTALKEEDENTRQLVKLLLARVYQNEDESEEKLKKLVQATLDSEIEKMIDAGLVDETVLLED